MKRTVYLAGKIDGLSFNDSLNWRVKATHLLADTFKCYIPAINEECIWDKDYFFLNNSDIILVNFDYENNSPFLGTSMEIGRAFYQQKPIIIFSSKDWVHKNHTLKYHATAIVKTLEEAIILIKEFK